MVAGSIQTSHPQLFHINPLSVPGGINTAKKYVLQIYRIMGPSGRLFLQVNIGSTTFKWIWSWKLRLVHH